VFVSVACVLCTKKRLLLSRTLCCRVSEGFVLCSHHSFVITDSKWWIVITWLTEIYQRVNESWGSTAKGKSTRLRTAPIPSKLTLPTSIPPKFIPFKNRPSTFHIFFWGSLGIVMVTYHYHRMDVINFDCSLTAFRKPRLAEKVKAYFLHFKPETTGGKFSYQETNLSSRSAGMQKTLQSPLFLLQPTSHLQHPDVELLTLHIQLLLYFSKTSQFLFGCYDIRIAVCITICTKVATYCAVSQTLHSC